ncbi:Ig-like domain-containing protein [Agromyces sp. NPDC058110]|uniref:Ig-like domain-containing protein n=1 Tax=Agromyces sp. NPDC058110 TaxID=3346345 RepID=UPI0036DC2FEA
MQRSQRKHPSVARWLAAVAIAVLGVGTFALGGATAASAAEVDTWGGFSVSPAAPFTGAVAMPGTFPSTTFTSTSSSATVVSGASTWQAASTPVGAVFGSSRDRTYLNQRPAANNAASPSVTTYTFASPTPTSGWAFVLGDIDADQVTLSATGTDGAAVPVEGLGYQESYNSCHRSGGPSCDAANLNDRPAWADDGTTGLLLGNAGAADTDGATAWFAPSVPLATLTMSFRWRSGFPIYQTWFVAKTFAAGGTVTLDGAPLAGATVTVLDDAGAVIATAVSGASGSWVVPSLIASGPYRAVVVPPAGIAPVPDRSFSLVDSDASGVDFPFVTPPPPVAADDEAATLQGAPVDLPLLENDAAGSDEFPLLPESVRFELPQDAPAGTVLSADAKQLTVPGEGVWAVDADGVATFAPEPGFTGDATTVPYSVDDSRGGRATATASARAAPVVPAAGDDPFATPMGTPVRNPVLDNDVPGDPSVPLVPESFAFVLPVGAPAGSTLSDDGRTLVIAGEGTYAIGDDSWVTFTPEAAFAGAATPVPYTVSDVNGTMATAEILVTVSATAQPVGTLDQTSTLQGVPVAGPILANDAASSATESLLPDTIRYVLPDSPPAGSSVSADGRTMVIGGEGTYTVDPTSGEASFTPEPTFVGVATPAPYTVQDSAGLTASATIVVTVLPVTPLAVEDAETVPQGTPIVVDPLANDEPGTAAIALVPSSLTLQVPADAPDGSSLSPDGVLTIAGEGVYRPEPSGGIRFTPLPSFTGDATPVPYTVVDENGTAAASVISISVTPVEPAPFPDAATTPQATPITVDVLANDLPGVDAVPLAPTSVVLRLPDEAPAGTLLGVDGRSLVVPGEGAYTVDPATGSIAFAPERGFVGEATPVPYDVADANGTTAAGVLVVSVSPVTPVAGVDNAAVRYGEAATIDVLANDVSGNGADGGAPAPLVPGSVRLELPLGAAPDALSADGRTLDLDDVGRFVVDPASGAVTFTPASGFSGPTPVVPYTVLDANGTVARSSLLVDVAPAPPTEPPPTEPPPTGPPTAPPTAPGGGGTPSATTGSSGTTTLPATGSPVGALLVPALVLLVAGLVVSLGRRAPAADRSAGTGAPPPR